jgi:hypothetical protein
LTRHRPGTAFKGSQCAPGTPSKSPRYRGTLSYPAKQVGDGPNSALITLPAPTPTGYSLTACNFTSNLAPVVVGQTSYQGIMFYVPPGDPIGNNSDGIEFYELHFQNVYGAPLALQIHPTAVVIGLELGACYGARTSVRPSSSPGCAYRSGLTCSKGYWTCLPTQYAIPPGDFVEGRWFELITAVKWEAATNDGTIQTDYRMRGQAAWNIGASVSGVPTLQWPVGGSCCSLNYLDELEAYTFALKGTQPLTLYLDDAVNGTSLTAVQAAMP